MAERKAQGARRLRRLAGVVGGVAATAVCLSFAWSVVGGALRPASAPLPDPIVIAASHEPEARPPLPPLRTPALPRARAKFSASDARTSLAKNAPAEKTTAVPTPDTPPAAALSTTSLVAAASSLLRTESKTSRTRGQPAQD